MANRSIITRYDNEKAVLQYDSRMTVEWFSLLIEQLPSSVWAHVEPLERLTSAWMQHYNPPEHTRLRKLVSKTVTARMLERMRPRIQKIVGTLLDQVQDSDRMEVIHILHNLFPRLSPRRCLGVSSEDRYRFKCWSEDLSKSMESVGLK